MNLESRFWSKVDKRAPDECWRWLAATDRSGYGVMRPETSLDGGPVLRAHRASLLVHGTDPAGFHVLHHCDNPLCVNPAHLYLGDPADNARDKVSRNRQSRGETSGTKKLTESAVLEIRDRAAAGEVLKRLSDEFGVGLTAIWCVAHHRTWRHVGGPRLTSIRNGR